MFQVSGFRCQILLVTPSALFYERDTRHLVRPPSLQRRCFVV